jgi:polysaccharide biosynthesis protein PslH
MKILAITPYLPAPPDFGGAARIYNILQKLQEKAEVTVFSLCGAEDHQADSLAGFERLVTASVPMTARSRPSLAKRSIQMRSALSRQSFQRHFYWHRDAQVRLNELIAKDSFDIVQIEFSQMAAYETLGAGKRVIDLHNIEYDVLRQAAEHSSGPKSIFNRWEWRKLRNEEEQAWRGADLCLATSEPDAARVRSVTGGECLVVPNGVDDSFFQRQPVEASEPGAIVFTGAIRYQPNADAVIYFVRRVWPLIRDLEPSATFNIVGADPPDEVVRLGELSGVRVSGSVDDVRPWLRSASVVVVPLLSGGGTRLKILEAFSSGRPVVSTTVGASGLEVEDDKHLIISDRPMDMAQSVVSVLRDRKLAETLGDNAYQLVHANYRWSTIVDRLYARYEELLS